MYMDNALRERCLAVMEAQTSSTFLNQLVGFAHSLGFASVAACVVTDHSDTLTEFRTITNAPPAFLNDFSDLNKGKLDPVSQHCKHRSTPIVWGAETYRSAGLGEYWDFQSAFGYKQGIAVAMHFHRGRHFMIGVDGDMSLPLGEDRHHLAVQAFCTFASYAQAAAFDICLPPVTLSDNKSSLTPREIDALRWTMDGKTSRGVAAAMATSEEVASERLKNAMRKLSRGSKYEAVLQAIRLGLIQCE